VFLLDSASLNRFLQQKGARKKKTLFYNQIIPQLIFAGSIQNLVLAESRRKLLICTALKLVN